MIGFSLPLWGNVLVFLVAAITIALAGTKLAEYADRLADRTGLGEALTGTLLLGLTTALPGMTASVLAALQGHPGLALSNAIGGIAFQTTILAVADIAHRDANLEHAAASAENMMQTIMLILLIGTVLIGLSSPEVTVAHIHPVSFVLLFVAALAFWLVYRVREAPMWQPHQTEETVEDVPRPNSQRESLPRLGIGLAISATLTLVCGGLVAWTAGSIMDQTGIPESIMGGVCMAIATSLPELVTCVAAVRRGALTLAVSDIVGGNFFDVLFVAAADIAFIGGSLYHADGVGMREVFVVSITILLNVVLLAGLIYRQKYGPGNIGFESVLMLLIYVAGVAVLVAQAV